jgi:hypothetical protein
MKRWLLNEAHAVGIKFIVSMVHWDNERMIGMNKGLGGTTEHIMNGPYRRDEFYCRCVVPVKSWPLDP